MQIHSDNKWSTNQIEDRHEDQLEDLHEHLHEDLQS